MENFHLFIVTTTYHAKDVIGKTLDSLLMQTNNSFTHYIYDDGSNDELFDDIIEEYIKKATELNQPYKVIYKKGLNNVGCDKAHEYAFNHIDGTHVMWLDAGDYVSPYFVEYVSNVILKKTKYSFYHINCYEYDKKTNVISKTKDSDKYPLRLLKQHNQLGPWVFNYFYYNLFVYDVADFKDLFSGHIVFKDKDEHGGCFYDAQIILRSMALNKTCFYIKKPLAYIMKDDQSVSSNFAVNSGLADSCILSILDSDNRFKSFKYFYVPYKEKVKALLELRLLCRTKDGFKKGKAYYYDLKSYIKNNHCSEKVFFCRKYYYKIILLLGSNPITRLVL